MPHPAMPGNFPKIGVFRRLLGNGDVDMGWQAREESVRAVLKYLVPDCAQSGHTLRSV